MFQNNKQRKAQFGVEDFPSCCTAKILCDFGSRDNEDDVWSEAGFDFDSADQIIERCNTLIPQLKKDGFGVVVAITTSCQTEAAEAFTRMGFYTNEKPMKKGRNKDTGDLFIWFMPTHEFKPVKL